jgi:hypothetical protein
LQRFLSPLLVQRQLRVAGHRFEPLVPVGNKLLAIRPEYRAAVHVCTAVRFGPIRPGRHLELVKLRFGLLELLSDLEPFSDQGDELGILGRAGGRRKGGADRRHGHGHGGGAGDGRAA